MEEGNIESVNFQNYQVHVLAAVLKSFFREMPEPLLTFDSYEDFLRAANLTDPQDRVSTLFTILKKLPKPNFDLMERLIFHLARFVMVPFCSYNIAVSVMFVHLLHYSTLTFTTQNSHCNLIMHYLVVER
jgi:hypothetical protein